MSVMNFNPELLPLRTLLEDSASLRLLTHGVSVIEPSSRTMTSKPPAAMGAVLFSRSFAVNGFSGQKWHGSRYPNSWSPPVGAVGSVWLWKAKPHLEAVRSHQPEPGAILLSG